MTWRNQSGNPDVLLARAVGAYVSQAEHATRHLKGFLRLRCAPDLLAWEVFPRRTAAKEITETMAATVAVFDRLGIKQDNHAVSLVAVGDGCTPRTAATFACLSAWQCYSVDPRLRERKEWAQIRRLTIVPSRIEDWSVSVSGPLVIVAVHSHAPLAPCLERLTTTCPNERHLVAIPCCKPQEINGRPPDREYVDWGILSPERVVRIWRAV